MKTLGFQNPRGAFSPLPAPFLSRAPLPAQNHSDRYASFLPPSPVISAALAGWNTNSRMFAPRSPVIRIPDESIRAEPVAVAITPESRREATTVGEIPEKSRADTPDAAAEQIRARLKGLKTKPFPFGRYSPEVDGSLAAFQAHAQDLLHRIRIPEDGDQPIHLIITDDLSANACYFTLANGENVIALNVGLLETLDSDEELAFILGHELEHGLSQLQKKIDQTLPDQSGLDAALLQRAVENEVDVKSIARMIRFGFNPHAALDWLKRIRLAFGDPLNRTHTLLTTRISIIDGALTGKARVLGENSRFRLDDGARHRDVLGGVKQDVFASGRLHAEKLAEAESKLDPRGIADAFYEAVAKGDKAAFPKDETRYNEYGRAYAVPVFQVAFEKIWRDVQALLPPGFDPYRNIEFQLRLTKNLHDDFERSKARFLSVDFTPRSRDQFEALVAVEKRTYPIQIPLKKSGMTSPPNIVYFLEARNRSEKAKRTAEASLAKARVDGDERAIAEAESRLRTAETDFLRKEKELNIAASLFEPNEKRTEFLAQKSEHIGNSYHYDPAAPEFARTIAYEGLRVRIIHELVMDAPEREKRLRTRGILALLLTETPGDFLAAFEKLDFANLSPDDCAKALEKAAALFDLQESEAQNDEKRFLFRHSLVTVLGGIFNKGLNLRKINPDAFQKFAHGQMTRLLRINTVDNDVYPLLRDVGPLLLPALPGLGDATDLIANYQETLLKKLSGSFLSGTESSSFWTDTLPFYAFFLGALENTAIAPYDHPLMGDLIANLSGKFAAFLDDDGITPEKARSLLYIIAPTLIPGNVTPAEFDAAIRDFLELSAHPRFKEVLGNKKINLYAAMMTLTRSHAALSEDQKRMEREQQTLSDKLYGEDAIRAYALPDGPERVAAYAQEETFEKRLDEIRESIDAATKERVNHAYEMFLVLPPEIWNWDDPDKNFVERLRNGQNLHLALDEDWLGRLTQERPWDVARAGVLFNFNPGYMYEKKEAFLLACFQWHLNEYGSVTEAAYRFWQSLDEAGIAPTKERLDGLNKLISQFYGAQMPGRGDFVLTDPDFFMAYCDGVTRFVIESAAAGGPKADYTHKGRETEASKKKGSIKFERNLRINWYPVSYFWNDPKNYQSLPPEKVAKLFLLETSQYEQSYGTKESDAVVRYLWDKRNESEELRALLLDPSFVSRCKYQSSKEKIALWQLEQVPGFTDFLGEFASARTGLPAHDEIRPSFRLALELVKAQFPEKTPARLTLIREIERRLLPGEAETELLAELGITASNWVDLPILIGLDGPDAVAREIKSPADRAHFIRYFMGLEPDIPPSSSALSRHTATNLKKIYDQSSDIVHVVTLQALLGDGLDSPDSPVYAMVKSLIMGDAATDEPLSILFDTYLSVLPPGERKLLIAGALERYDPLRGGIGSFKMLLESGGPLGAKAAQNLITSGLVTGALRQELMHSFDLVLAPTRKEIFDQLKKAFDQNYGLITGVGRLIGSGSLNYVVEVYFAGHDGPIAVRMQKDHVAGQIDNEYQVWQKVCALLKAHANPLVQRYGRLIGSIADTAYATLNPNGVELDLERERNKRNDAAVAYARAEPDPASGLRVDVANPLIDVQNLVASAWQTRVSAYEYVEHVKLESIADENFRRAIVMQIMGAEFDAIGTGTFDPDGHKGNWLVDIAHGRLVRVDYAQIDTIAGGPSYLADFKAVIAALSLPVSMGGPMSAELIEGSFERIFNEDKPDGLKSALDAIFTSERYPDAHSPMEKLLFIQNELEIDCAKRGLAKEFTFRPAIARPMASLLRLNMYRSYVGDAAYDTRLARFIMG